MPKYWLISDRNNGGVGSGRNISGLTFWVSDAGPLNRIDNWQRVTNRQFRTLLAAATDQFPLLPVDQNEDQAHLTILIHGFNSSFSHATNNYQNICERLFDGPSSLGLCILYDWPLLDMAQARASAEGLANVLSELFEWLSRKQKTSFRESCKAKLSLIAHGIGAYVLQKAMLVTWNTQNRPAHVNWINQLAMIAANVDNDLFDSGAPDSADGNAMLNLSHRITALYSSRDSVLGASAQPSQFSRRRLGRSGLANRPPTLSSATDNVWDVDCSSFFPVRVSGGSIHAVYFQTDAVVNLMRVILRGLERDVLEATGIVPPAPPISVERPPMKVAPPDTVSVDATADPSGGAHNTMVDSLLTKIKNNRVLALVIVLGTVLSGLAVFTDTISKIPDAVGKIRGFVFGSPQTETERKLVMEVGHRASEALKRLQEDEQDINLGTKKPYPVADIFYNVVRHLDNSFAREDRNGPNYSAFDEYRTSDFQSLIRQLVALKGADKQLQRTWAAFEELDKLSQLKSDERNKERSLEAVTKAREIIRNELLGKYFKSSIN
jgi:hypothetical protein